MRKRILLLAFALAGLLAAPAARGQGYTDALLTSINQNTDFPCGNNAGTDTGNIQQAIKAAAHFGGGTVDLTCYQGPVSITADIFSGVSAKILLYLPEHAVTVTVAATIPSNFEICGGPGSSISGGSLTNNAAACFNGFTGGGGGTPGGGDQTIQWNNAGTFDGILDSVVSTGGEITLNHGFTVNSTTVLSLTLSSDTASLNFVQLGNGGLFSDDSGSGGTFIFDEGTQGIQISSLGQGGGSGPLNLTSAGSVNIIDTANGVPANGILIQENGTSDGQGIFINDAGGSGIDIESISSIQIGTAAGTSPINIASAGGVSITDNSAVGMSFTETGASAIFLTATNGVSLNGSAIDLNGGTSSLDLDDITPGVATLTTILNAVGGFQANGVAGISEVCTVAPTGITISFGIITAISGGTCVP